MYEELECAECFRPLGQFEFHLCNECIKSPYVDSVQNILRQIEAESIDDQDC